MLKKFVFYTLTIIILLLTLEFLGVLNFIPNARYHSTVTSGLVINKYSNKQGDYYIQLGILGEQNSELEKVKVSVPSENLWNLIEVNRTYFVVYEWQNKEVPTLLQIEINDNYKDKIDKRTKQKPQ